MSLVFSRSDMVDAIFNALDHDRARGGHTVETLLALLQDAKVVTVTPGLPIWTLNDTRLIIVELLKTGQLGMSHTGQLTIPECEADPGVELFRGAWYATNLTGHIKGPFKTEGEAHECINAEVRTKRQR